MKAFNLTILVALLTPLAAAAAQEPLLADYHVPQVSISQEQIDAFYAETDSQDIETTQIEQIETATIEVPSPLEPLKYDLGGKRRHSWVSPYALPYSRHCTGGANWHRMWINTAVLSGAFISTLFVLECLPEDATAWNRAAIQRTPMFKRWYRNIFVLNPEIDHDLFIFNYVLHPYAGAVYYMGARSCGFSMWGSLLYSFCVSTIGWEFGIEAFMERPSYQDIVVTPVVGSVFGELMYKGKRAIVERGYDVLGSAFLGKALCFVLDPVNEVIDLFRGNPCRDIARQYGRERRRSTEAFLALAPNSVNLTIKF